MSYNTHSTRDWVSYLQTEAANVLSMIDAVNATLKNALRWLYFLILFQSGKFDFGVINISTILHNE
ncbi:hypothetical protein MC7420_5520 [Coleofasciculus chthonoplastes PCC 7420]|uniref:Uncharacterized protein n=1 Tax=Coleofasciculus chthonoplastes PCC 7420 TaxID=118168 RepID=B4VP90_9CYAN|nr:hypothetical protein MC7420_5520 [Coleofasciculus chthonoplastes PCC 7420]